MPPRTFSAPDVEPNSLCGEGDLTPFFFLPLFRFFFGDTLPERPVLRGKVPAGVVSVESSGSSFFLLIFLEPVRNSV
eukprot:9073785-Pyramimonas_sp.AAC.3